MKKFLLKLLFNKKQREIIWQALIFSEYTYRRRGNVDAAAVVQTVINETQSTLGVVKETYTKEELDYIVANVIKDTRAESEKRIKDAFKFGADSCKKELETAYNKGMEDAMNKITVGAVIIRKDDIEQKQDSSENDEQGQTTTDENIQESTQQEEDNQISTEGK